MAILIEDYCTFVSLQKMLVLLVSVCLLSGRVADGRPSEEKDPHVRPGHVDSVRFEIIFL